MFKFKEDSIAFTVSKCLGYDNGDDLGILKKASSFIRETAEYG